MGDWRACPPTYFDLIFFVLFVLDLYVTFEQVIEDCLSRYQPSEVCISFNGGKDCSALLHLVHAAWVKLNQRQSTPAPMPRLRALYIRSQDPFPEMEHFIEETRQRYYRLEIEFILYFFL